mmetsp:Transcript_1734/g.5775  ORF Transcript_1734/g.5775 Transcript_1734/m.5775 type:complete len:301 (+) Transcript_1734:217-1119(+)
MKSSLGPAPALANESPSVSASGPCSTSAQTAATCVTISPNRGTTHGTSSLSKAHRPREAIFLIPFEAIESNLSSQRPKKLASSRSQGGRVTWGSAAPASSLWSAAATSGPRVLHAYSKSLNTSSGHRINSGETTRAKKGATTWLPLSGPSTSTRMATIVSAMKRNPCRGHASTMALRQCTISVMALSFTLPTYPPRTAFMSHPWASNTASPYSRTADVMHLVPVKMCSVLFLMIRKRPPRGATSPSTGPGACRSTTIHRHKPSSSELTASGLSGSMTNWRMGSTTGYVMGESLPSTCTSR